MRARHTHASGRGFAFAVRGWKAASWSTATMSCRDLRESPPPVTGRVKRNFRIAAIVLDPKIPAAAFRSRVFGAFDSVAAFYRENSYGDWTLEGDVFGPYAIPLGDCAASDVESRRGCQKRRRGRRSRSEPLRQVPLPRASDASCTWKFLSDFGVNEVRGLFSGVDTWYTLTNCATLAYAVGVSFGLRRSHQ